MFPNYEKPEPGHAHDESGACVAWDQSSGYPEIFECEGCTWTCDELDVYGVLLIINRDCPVHGRAVFGPATAETDKPTHRTVDIGKGRQSG